MYINIAGCVSVRDLQYCAPRTDHKARLRDGCRVVGRAFYESRNASVDDGN